MKRSEAERVRIAQYIRQLRASIDALEIGLRHAPGGAPGIDVAQNVALGAVTLGLHVAQLASYEIAEKDASAPVEQAAKPVCARCNDTHRVPAPEDHAGPFGDGTWMCTSCPSPCQKCRQGGNGPFCETTPCACDCHRRRA